MLLALAAFARFYWITHRAPPARGVQIIHLQVADGGGP